MGLDRIREEMIRGLRRILEGEERYSLNVKKNGEMEVLEDDSSVMSIIRFNEEGLDGDIVCFYHDDERLELGLKIWEHLHMIAHKYSLIRGNMFSYSSLSNI